MLTVNDTSVFQSIPEKLGASRIVLPSRRNTEDIDVRQLQTDQGKTSHSLAFGFLFRKS